MIKITLKGVDAEFKSKDKELTYTVNQIARVQAIDTVAKLKERTPVDTGRAKNSWVLSKNKNKFLDAKGGYTASVGGPGLGPVSDSKIETLYATNGTPYIEDLNRGTSQQAPARFVEATIAQQQYTPLGVLFETITTNKD